MLSSYRTLLGRPGAPALALVCAVGWMSFTGYALALILAIHHLTGSYATAGVAVAVQAIGAGAIAPLRGRLVDRHGPRPLRVLGASHALAGAALTATLLMRLTAPTFVCAGALGASTPPLIAVARGQWVRVAGPGLERTGHALNAALSDAAVIAAPAVVAAVALATAPLVTMALLVAGAAGAAFFLAAQLPPADPDEPAPDRAPTPPSSGGGLTGFLGVISESQGLQVLAACDVATAGWLSGLEIAVIALAGRHGPPELGAFTLAALALGSIVVSLAAGTAQIASAPALRYRAGAVLAAVAIPLVLLTTACRCWPRS